MYSMSSLSSITIQETDRAEIRRQSPAKKMTALVFADWSFLKKPLLIGELKEELNRGVYSFAYSDEWLKTPTAQGLIMPFGQLQKHRTCESGFSLLFDSLPDQWGQTLFRKYEALKAKVENRTELDLGPLNYLHFALDLQRLGGMRIKIQKDEPFVTESFGLFEIGFLPSLYHSSLVLEDNNPLDHPEYEKHLRFMVLAGASFGGKRPKANVLDKNNRLWMAKFPSRSDTYDVGGWEMVVHELARLAGIHLPEAKAMRVSNDRHIFIAKRFDRDKDGKRFHYTSAKGLLQHINVQKNGNELLSFSYLDIAEFITKYSHNPKADLKELWRRILFNICVKNTDDHLKNHGFLLNHKGWMLSPAFDMNSEPAGTELTLNISMGRKVLDLDLAMDVADDFSLNSREAIRILKTVKRAVCQWENIANHFGMSSQEQAFMAPAFGLAKR